jgi:hypothetical protein
MRGRLVLLLLGITTAACGKSTIPPQPAKAGPQVVTPEPQKRGRWHMAEDGHAVFCYGPVMTVSALPGDPKRMATRCQGRSPNVLLHD